MKNKYEFLIVFRGTGTEQSIKDNIDRVNDEFGELGADVQQVQNMDRQEFSYVADDLSSGYYVNYIVECDPSKVDSILAKFKLDDAIYRQSCMKLDSKKVA